MPRGLTLPKRVDDGSKSKSRGWMDGNRGGLTAGILKSAEEYTTTLHGDGDGDGEKNSGSGGGDSVGGGAAAELDPLHRTHRSGTSRTGSRKCCRCATRPASTRGSSRATTPTT